MRAPDDRHILDNKQACPFAVTARDPAGLCPALAANITYHRLAFRCHAFQASTVSRFPVLSRPLSRRLSLLCLPACGLPSLSEEGHDLCVGFACEKPRLLISDAPDHFNGFDLNLLCHKSSSLVANGLQLYHCTPGRTTLYRIRVRANARLFDGTALHVVASEAKQSPVLWIEIASSLRSSE